MRDTKKSAACSIQGEEGIKLLKHQSGRVNGMKGSGDSAYVVGFLEDQMREYMTKEFRREVWYGYYFNLDSHA